TRIRVLRPEEVVEPAYGGGATAHLDRVADDGAADRRGRRRNCRASAQLRHRPNDRTGGPCRRIGGGHAPGESLECARPPPPRRAGDRNTVRTPRGPRRIPSRP